MKQNTISAGLKYDYSLFSLSGIVSFVSPEKESFGNGFGTNLSISAPFSFADIKHTASVSFVRWDYNKTRSSLPTTGQFTDPFYQSVDYLTIVSSDALYFSSQSIYKLPNTKFVLNLNAVSKPSLYLANLSIHQKISPFDQVSFKISKNNLEKSISASVRWTHFLTFNTNI